MCWKTDLSPFHAVLNLCHVVLLFLFVCPSILDSYRCEGKIFMADAIKYPCSLVKLAPRSVCFACYSFHPTWLFFLIAILIIINQLTEGGPFPSPTLCLSGPVIPSLHPFAHIQSSTSLTFTAYFSPSFVFLIVAFSLPVIPRRCIHTPHPALNWFLLCLL